MTAQSSQGSSRPPFEASSSRPSADSSAQPVSVATIDLGAVSSNVSALVRLVPGAAVMSVVKANGYGHGAVPVARAALRGGAGWLGVADLAEALELRDAGIDAPILAWLHDPSTSFEDAVAASIDIGVSDLAQLRAVADCSDASGAGPARVHLKVDTGLGRNGAEESLWDELFALAAAEERAGRLAVRGLFSHLSNADDREDSAQLARFHEAAVRARSAGLSPDLLHLASSAAAIRLSHMRFSLVRIGIACYGLSPFDRGDSAALGLSPAMTLESRVVDADDSSAIVPLGYAHGVPRHAAGRIRVRVGARSPLVSRIEADHLVLDSEGLAAGDRVLLFGDPALGAPSVDQWASAAGTINYEIVTRLGASVPRRYLP